MKELTWDEVKDNLHFTPEEKEEMKFELELINVTMDGKKAVF